VVSTTRGFEPPQRVRAIAMRSLCLRVPRSQGRIRCHVSGSIAVTASPVFG